MATSSPAATCRTQKPLLGSGGSGSAGGGTPSTEHAASSASSRFSRCRQATTGRPAATRCPNRCRSVSARSVRAEGKSAPRPGTFRMAMASTDPPKRAAYGATLSVHRRAGELITRARGAKQASRSASASASSAPSASSGRIRSSPGQAFLWPAEACLSRISGTVGRGCRLAITSASWG
jgi:hypothetical protein